ncbi:hypothetical protein ACFL4T_10580 [candidate division KSB1 bacterium]
MKRFFSLAVILLLLSTAFPQEVNWFKGTFDEAKIKAGNEGKQILIEFFTKGG